MRGLMIDTPVCDYCNILINRDIEPIVETRVTDNNLVPINQLVEVAHKECWVAINTVVNTVLEYSSDMLTKRVDKDSQVV
jgi:hypothetical protein